MAYIRRDKRRWRAEIDKAGVRLSRTFETKAAAASWATAEEAAIIAGSRGKFPARTVSEALDRYIKDVSAKKRGARSEALRIEALKREFPALCASVMHAVSTPDLVKWRDARLKVVSGSSVARDINLFRNVWTVAANEWHWTGPSPWRALGKPAENPARTRRVSWREVRRIMRWSGYRVGVPPSTKTGEAAYAFLIAMHTAMRSGELMGLTRDAVNLKARVVTLLEHKTVEAVGARKVPITRNAAKLLTVLIDAAKANGRQALFTTTARNLDALWRKMRTQMTGMDGLHFHDSRAEALTLLARRVDVMTLARISGHRDLRILLETYYRETPEQIAGRL